MNDFQAILYDVGRGRARVEGAELRDDRGYLE